MQNTSWFLSTVPRSTRSDFTDTIKMADCWTCECVGECEGVYLPLLVTHFDEQHLQRHRALLVLTVLRLIWKHFDTPILAPKKRAVELKDLKTNRETAADRRLLTNKRKAMNIKSTCSETDTWANLGYNLLSVSKYCLGAFQKYTNGVHAHKCRHMNCAS